ncbi:hypothetical protein BVI434_3520005 [Burkholderia vietnamiensis]|nr:hypothetical protein BVI434_3520005 [Burkholderia vietnamiensis]
MLPDFIDDLEWDGYSEISFRQGKYLGERSHAAQFLNYFRMTPCHNHCLNAHQRLNSTVATSQSRALT